MIAHLPIRFAIPIEKIVQGTGPTHSESQAMVEHLECTAQFSGRFFAEIN